MNLLILSPLAIEMNSLLLRMKQLGQSSVEEKKGFLKTYYFADLKFRFAIAGHGKTQFGIQTQYLIHQLPETEAIICAGCAGGLTKVVQPGHVVVATETIEHDYQLKFVKRPDPQFVAHSELLKKISSVTNQNFQVHFGPVASGDEDIVDQQRAMELQAQTKAIAVAWEGAGGARACQFNQMPYLEIRGVTDSANSKATSDFAVNLQPAMSNVCDLLVQAFK